MNNSKDCKDYRQNYEFYFSLPCSILNIIFNSFNIIVFIKLIFKNMKSDFYKYLMIKSIADLYIGFRFLFRDIAENMIFHAKIKSKHFFFMVLYVIFIKYLVSMAGLVSCISDCFSCLDRLIMCVPSWKNVKRTHVKLVYLALIVFFFLFYIFKFFEQSIIAVQIKDPYNISLNSTWYQVNSDNKNYYYFIFIHNLLKDVLTGFISLILNLITFIFLKKTVEKKKSLKKTRNSSTASYQTVLDSAEWKIFIMITITSIISFTAHITNFIYESEYFQLDKCFKIFGSFFYEISFADSFIIYLIFNKNFREIFKNFLKLKIKSLKVEPKTTI